MKRVNNKTSQVPIEESKEIDYYEVQMTYEKLTPKEAVAAARHDVETGNEAAWAALDHYLNWNLLDCLRNNNLESSKLEKALEEAAGWALQEKRSPWQYQWPYLLKLLQDGRKGSAAPKESQTPVPISLRERSTSSRRASIKAKLRKATLRIVARVGYAETTFEKIAAETDLSKATVYHNYSSKLDLIKEAVAIELHKLDDTVPLPSLSIESDLLNIAHKYQTFWREHIHLIALIPEVSRIPELKSIFIKEQRVVVDKWIALCLHHRARGSWLLDFDELSPEQLEWNISSLLLGPLLSQVIWNEVGLSYGMPYEPKQLVTNVLQGIVRYPDRPGTSTARHLDMQKFQGPPATLPADLDIRVRLKRAEGSIRLMYSLNAPTGKVQVTHKEIEGPKIYTQPEAYQASLIQKLEMLHIGCDSEGKPLPRGSASRSLTSLGQQLYSNLFPPELRHAYRNFRNKIKSLQIVSDEPWIPWELIKPYEAEHPAIDDDFLASKFLLTRWIAGDRAAPTAARVQSVACLDASSVPDFPPLPKGKAERDIFNAWAAKHDLENISPPNATCKEVLEMLRRGVDWIHFIGHGGSDSNDNDEYELQLNDGALCIADFDGEIQSVLAKSRPFVFLNSCQSGHQAWRFTGISGWVRLWLEGCASSVFIGSHWTVSDELAHAFAMEFYTAVIEKSMTFGEAAQHARIHVRNLQPESPSWLAFAVYAHPHGRLALKP